MLETILKKKLNPLRILAIMSVILIPIFIILIQDHHTAYAEILPSYKKTNVSQGVVTAWALNVRASGDASSPIIDVVHQGDTLNILHMNNGWDEVTLSDNQTGWVNDNYISQTNENTSASSATNTNITIPDPNQTTDITNIPGTIIEALHSLGRFVQVQSIETVSLQSEDEPLKGKTIVLDPGHGGKDNGTTSDYSGTPEKALTLATAQVVEQKLEAAGAHVIMTRSDDSFIPLQERADISNQNNADAFISFHYNTSYDPSISGVTDFYYQETKDNPLASDVLNEVSKTTGLQNRGTRFDNLHVLRNNDQPCTLIELGFLSNPQEDAVVESTDYREKVAQGVYLGLVDYFSNGAE